MILATLKALHLLALVFGSVASLGNIYLMLASGPHDLPSPGFTGMLRKLYRVTALGAIALFWLSGAVLLFARYGAWVEGPAFAAKMALVTFLTAIVLFLNLMAGRWARRGGPPPWTKFLHIAGAASLILIVVLAAAAFG